MQKKRMREREFKMKKKKNDNDMHMCTILDLCTRNNLGDLCKS